MLITTMRDETRKAEKHGDGEHGEYRDSEEH